MANLGDNLWLTPLLWSVENSVLTAIDHPHISSILPLFDGICEIELQKDVPGYKLDNNSHATEQIAAQLGITLKTKIPEIIVKPEEVAWAKDFLKDYPNPIAMINDNIGANAPGNVAALYRRPPQHYIQEIATKLSKTHTVLQFGVVDNFMGSTHKMFTPLEGAVHIRGLPTRQLAALYHAIGKYIGGDTGDYHLMVAVGGKAIVLIPPNNPAAGYPYQRLLYKDEFWQGTPRVTYYQHRFEPNLNPDFYDLI